MKTELHDKYSCGHQTAKGNKEDKKTTLRKAIKNDLKPNNIKIQDLQSLARDRQVWRTMTSALCAKHDTIETD
jgi:hypothetical protein